jgi:hypothetical protein
MAKLEICVAEGVELVMASEKIIELLREPIGGPNIDLKVEFEADCSAIR